MKWLIRQLDRLLRWLQCLFKRKRQVRPPLSTSHPAFHSYIDQNSQGDRNQIIAQMSGGTAIENVEGAVYIGATIYQSDLGTSRQDVHEEDIDSVKQGLNALAALTRIPEVRRSLITYQVRFEAACQQIDTIANYKTLHDLLHTLELDCYRGILQESKRLSEDSTTLIPQINHDPTLQKLLGGIQKIEDSTILYNLIDRDRDLQNLLRRIEKITTTKTFSAHEVRWLTNLQEAQTELHTAIEKRELHRLSRSINLLKRVLAIQPSRVNTSLVTAARSLRLPSLVSPIQLILEELVDATLDQEKLQQFQRGVESLRVLDSQLNALITGHDNWQVFDLELWRIEDNLDQNLDELKVSWPDLLERTKVLISPTIDEWMIIFQQDIQDLDAALKSQNPFKIKQCFHLYCRQAKKSFYQVDEALKHLCQELREVGGALASVMRIIE
ncbi:MAG: hypothetical protein B0A82_10430 [Alkalinema sp. CACIAM 70d]|nr:MAG: hypothetical protein B0A82_10430 [Alkalinema sp. CACIAM 70d]